MSQISGLDGNPALQLAPDYLLADIATARAKCEHVYRAKRNPEFYLMFGEVSYRVTALESINDTVFTLRQTHEPRPASELRIGDKVLGALLQENLRGLVLVCGERAVGKTSTAASVFVERIKVYGGLGLAVEDPPEMKLEGPQGKGYVLQVWADPQKGGYPEQMRRGMRSGAESIFLGEIRDGITASEACRAGIDGHLVMSTGHGGSPVEGLERIHALASTHERNAAQLLADGVALVVWQTLDTVVIEGLHKKRPQTRMLRVKGNSSVQSKIREGKFAALQQELDQQSNAAAWTTAAKK
ncbi:ATPase, T2SS/T4P/T4SS family [Paraburkholderia sacchari]|uniref:Flp pilus assembly complex ATPase component TadA n=1 Tax=Paraburkholderia sacchari TaxID=159450 RepID=A0A8T6ZJX4_9BURK|nr:ATPase, T2SS/T4P/T4SS family [Paraburkholderia sacchari]NLP65487.1 Flp pilus assembly complex ATPase component TadA [Paraburkholderia sacchari]NLP65572.1 Flp pilus assembly complex ATPase component TadA [Paraburkholderia sacchari]